MLESFEGRTAVVTGAASGIGLGIARAAATAGMNVVLADVEEPALTAAEADIAAIGGETLVVVTDVSNEESVAALAAAAFERFDEVNLLCNNAGVFQGGISWQRTQADWDWVFGVNVWGILHAIRAFVPRLLEQDGPAHIVNTSSTAGLISVAYSGPYVVSKFAAASLTECLAHDLRSVGSEIGVSCLVPGAVDTRIAASARNRPDEPPSEAQAPDHHVVAAALADLTPTGRHPDEVGQLVLDAVGRGDFWIPTSDSFDGLMRSRNDAVLERRLPDAAQFD